MVAIEDSVCAEEGSSKRRPKIHHPDRGVQYYSNEYMKVLKKNNVASSMTEGSHCYENVLASGSTAFLMMNICWMFKDFAHAEKSCRGAVMPYNTLRPHHALKFKTPEQVYHAA